MTENVQKLPWGKSAELEFYAHAAHVLVEGIAEGEAPRLEAHPSANFQISEHGNLTRVTMSPPSWNRLPFFFSGGEVKLFLPKNVKAKLSTEAGPVRISKLEGCELELSTNAGVIDLFDVRGKLQLRTGAGTISGRGVGGLLNMETSAGTITLDVDQLLPGESRLRSSMGAITVRLAAGMDLRIDARTSLGSVRTRYPSRADAPAQLRLETDLGSVKVKELGGLHDHEHHHAHEHHQHEHHGAHHHAHQHGHGDGQGHGWPPFSFNFQWPPQPPAPPPPAAPVSDEELRRILTLVQEQKLTAEQAQELLRAMERR